MATAATIDFGRYRIVNLGKVRSDLRTKDSVEAGISLDKKQGNMRLIEYRPGNGRTYNLLISHLCDLKENDIQQALGISDNSILVYVLGKVGNFTVNLDRPIDYKWVQQELNCSIIDAVVISELVGSLYNLKYISSLDYLAGTR